MPSKKNKNDPKQQEPLKPLGHYVKDRLELTKQLFSCLKSKQIKSRLPANMQNLSMERIQQLCLDEILGISSKRLLSIINNTKCPLDTESDSDIEHISLSEISSSSDDLEIEDSTNKQKKTTEEPSKSSTTVATAEKSSSNSLLKKPGEKEMTMLELLELQARARAIRSQLALEPVTKIELDSDDDDVEVTEREKETEAHSNNEKSSEQITKSTSNKSDESKDARKSKTKNDNSTVEGNESNKFKDKNSVENRGEKLDKSKKTSLSPPRPKRVVILKSPEKSLKDSKNTNLPEKEKPKVSSAPPIKLKRNFPTTSDNDTSIKTNEKQSKAEEIKSENESKEIQNASRTSSPDVITMEQNIATYFISDSEDENEPPPKKSASPKSKIVVTSIEIISPPLTYQIGSSTIEEINKPEEENSQTQNEQNSQQEEEQSKEILSQKNKSIANENESIHEDDDDNVVNIMMSDTEIDLNEDEVEKQESTVSSSQEAGDQSLKNKTIKVSESKMNLDIQPQTSQEQTEDFDDDVVEILHSDDDELLDLDKPNDSSKNSDDSETWEKRYLRSSNVTSVLKTTKLASKVRDKIVQKKRTLRSSKKNDESKEKEIKEKMIAVEEGSMEQFEVLKESKDKE